MIPKTLIYCNFGNMNIRPEIEGKCMKSWEKYFPKSKWNWVELNESTYPINNHKFTKLAYENKHYNLVSDYARVDYLYHHGGIYVDTDLLMLKPLDNNILDTDKFFFGNTINSKIFKLFKLIQNQESQYIISWGLVGANKNNKILKEILNRLDNYEFKESIDDMAEMRIIKDIYHDKLLDIDYFNIYEDENIKMYPYEYFTCNKNNEFSILSITDKSYAVHLYANSWTDKDKYYRILKKLEGLDKK